MRSYLRQLRLKKKLTQAEVANMLNISQNYYSAIENGERQKNMDFSLMRGLSRLFGVTVEYLAKEEERLLRK